MGYESIYRLKDTGGMSRLTTLRHQGVHQKHSRRLTHGKEAIHPADDHRAR
jgi:hypothetical protein